MQDGRLAAAALQQECIAAGDRCAMLLNDGVLTIDRHHSGSGMRASGVTTQSGKRWSYSLIP